MMFYEVADKTMWVNLVSVTREMGTFHGRDHKKDVNYFRVTWQIGQFEVDMIV